MVVESHRALEQLLRGPGRLPAEVAVSFRAPVKQWVDSLTRPTVDLFLFDVQENTAKRQTNMQTVRADGRAERRMKPRRIDLYYMVSVLASEFEDEHELLWRVLATLMKHQEFPVEVLPEPLWHLEPPLSGRISEKDETERLISLWNALGTPPHPALCYVVTTSLDLDVALEAPLVLTRRARYKDMTSSAADPYEVRFHIGGLVRDTRGHPLAGVSVRVEGRANASTTDEQGRFVLSEVPSGHLGLMVSAVGKEEKRTEITVPADAYEIVLDE